MPTDMTTEPEPQAEAIAPLAESIARKAHLGQERRGGAPYITHPERIAATFTGDLDKAAAWLHDALEDTPVTAADLLAQGVPSAVVRCVEILTKEPMEDYSHFIERVALSDVAARIKIADILDNLSDSPSARQVEKYTAALDRLRAARELPECTDESPCGKCSVCLALKDAEGYQDAIAEARELPEEAVRQPGERATPAFDPALHYKGPKEATMRCRTCNKYTDRCICEPTPAAGMSAESRARKCLKSIEGFYDDYTEEKGIAEISAALTAHAAQQSAAQNAEIARLKGGIQSLTDAIKKADADEEVRQFQAERIAEQQLATLRAQLAASEAQVERMRGALLIAERELKRLSEGGVRGSDTLWGGGTFGEIAKDALAEMKRELGEGA